VADDLTNCRDDRLPLAQRYDQSTTVFYHKPKRAAGFYQDLSELPYYFLIFFSYSQLHNLQAVRGICLVGFYPDIKQSPSHKHATAIPLNIPLSTAHRRSPAAAPAGLKATIHQTALPIQ
jgi:hypothetical protein